MTESIKNELAANDVILKRIINTISEPKIISSNNVFHDIMSCILEQQIHYRSTKKIFQRMLNTAEITELTLDNFEQFEEKAFTNTKLSANKYETIVQTVEFFETNDIDWQQLSDKEIKKLLTTIKGVSNWTVEMLLLYTFTRPNVFPADDYHVKQIMTKLYEIPPEAKLKASMKAIAENWGEYKSTAVLYLLEWKKVMKNTKPNQ